MTGRTERQYRRRTREQLDTLLPLLVAVSSRGFSGGDESALD